MAGTYHTLLLDADDTLFDFHQAELYALQSTFHDFAIELHVGSYIDEFQTINAAVWREYETGQSTAQQVRTKRFVRLLRQLEIDLDPAAVSDSYVAHLGEATFMVDGARELLEILCGRIPMVLLTNGLSAVQRSRLSRAKVADYFDAIVISEEVGVQKPDPRVFEIALEQASAARKASGGSGTSAAGRQDALMVGDNLHSDIGGALRAGLDACWFNYRGKDADPAIRPTCVIESLLELPGIVGIEA